MLDKFFSLRGNQVGVVALFVLALRGRDIEQSFPFSLQVFSFEGTFRGSLQRFEYESQK